MAASKLLANSDRWADDAVISRDLIDLAMMLPDAALLRAALRQGRDGLRQERRCAILDKAIEALRARPHRLDRCMEALSMTTVSKAVLWQALRRLARVLPPPQEARGEGCKD